MNTFDPKIPNNDLILLPSSFDYDQKDILKATIKANNSLAKLNGLALLLPNVDLLMSPLLIKESIESNAIENINTTTVKVLQSEAIDSV
jgi:Fic family protein